MSRRRLGANVLGSIFKFLDITQYQNLVDDYPESLVIWRKHTSFLVTMNTYCFSHYVNGWLHGWMHPAVEYRYENKQEWWFGEKIHRTGGPAIIDGGNLTWMRYGELHRDDDKPAIVQTDGHREWWRRGVRHRVGGPAIIYADKKREWWFRGRPVNFGI